MVRIYGIRNCDSKAVALMVEFPGLIKRPVVETDSGQLLVGFAPVTFGSFVK